MLLQILTTKSKQEVIQFGHWMMMDELQENYYCWKCKPGCLVLRNENVLRKYTDCVFGTRAVKDRRVTR